MNWVPRTALAYGTIFYLCKIWPARQSIEVIYFAALFLPLDIQTHHPHQHQVSTMCSFPIFPMSGFGAYFNWVCPNLYRVALIFINPIFHDQNLYYWCLFIIELNSSMPHSRTRVISYALIPSASPLTSLHFNTPPQPCSYSHPLPLIEKQITVQPVLSSHPWGMAEWSLHGGWPLYRFHREGYYEK